MYIISHRLALRTELLQAHQVGDVQSSRGIRVGDLCIFRRLKIIKDVQDVVVSRRSVLYGLHVAEMPDLHVALAVRAVGSETLVSLARELTAARGAVSLPLAYGLSLRGNLFLVIFKTRPTPEISVTRIARDPKTRECARGNRNAVVTRLIARVSHVTPAPFITSSTHVLLGHRAVYVGDHVVVMIRFVIENVDPLL